MSAIDRIVEQNAALWTLLQQGDDMPRDQQHELINRAFPKNPLMRVRLKKDQRDTARAWLDQHPRTSGLTPIDAAIMGLIGRRYDDWMYTAADRRDAAIMAELSRK